MIHRKLNDIRGDLVKKDKHTSSMSFRVLIMKADFRGLQDTSKITAKDCIIVLKIFLIRRDHTKLYNIIGRVDSTAIFYIWIVPNYSSYVYHKL